MNRGIKLIAGAALAAAVLIGAAPAHAQAPSEPAAADIDLSTGSADVVGSIFQLLFPNYGCGTLWRPVCP
ncbi:hypothetical protein [Nocardia sp. NPDC005366]|uniref:hypothetical protein n=1 Tax=Nocardia sp. NPDC005366 TaxID=3156878 RepID=UPI0033A006C8